MRFAKLSLTRAGRPAVAAGAAAALVVAMLSGPLSAPASSAGATPSTTTLTASNGTVLVGQQVTYTATVTGGSGTPTGTVDFTDNGNPLCPGVSLDGAGKATCQFAYQNTAGSPHSIVANYSGDPTYDVSSDSLNETVNPATPAIGVTSAPNPSTPGDPVVYTATVTGQGDTPTGTVEFDESGSPLSGCSAKPLNGSGKATCQVTYNQVATHHVTATYSPGADPNYNAAGPSAPDDQAMQQGTPGVTLGSNNNPSNITESVTYTANVSGNGVQPTGNVTFTDGGSTIGGCGAQAVNISTGNATCGATYNAAGIHHIVATYNGNPNYNSAGSNTVTQTVQGGAGSNTALSSDNNPSAPGQQVTYTATVTGGGATPTGNVDFTDNTNPLCTNVALTNGVATCSQTYNGTGAHTIKANYGGDPTYGSSNDTITQNVNAVTSNTQLVPSGNPAAVGDTVVYTATVTPSSPTPTGTVDFLDGATVVCNNVPLSGGQATCGQIYSTTAGSPHSMTASYSGGGTYGPSTSGAVSEVVDKAPTATAVNSDGSPSTAGSPVLYTATITTPANGANPGGTVDFSDGGTAIAACQNKPVNGGSGTATCSQTYNAVGSHSITATYSGDSNYTGSPSSAFTQQVNAAAASTMQLVSGNGQQTTVGTVFPTALSVRVLDSFGNPVPGVTVNFSATVSAGNATCLYPSNSPTAAIVTDTNGLATVGAKANAQAGSYTAKANLPGVGNQNFSLTNVAGGPGTITVTGGNHQTTTVLHGFVQALTVRVTDGFSNPVPNTTVTFTAPASGASGTFTNFSTTMSVQTDGNGVGTTTLTANSVGGAFTIIVTAGTGVSNNLVETNAAVAPGQPTFVSASASGNLVTIVWGPPTYDGGSPVTSYTITLLPSGHTIAVNSATARSFQLVFFANGANLSVTVAADNGVGAGAPSAPATVFIVRAGYWMAASDGGIFNFGSTRFWGSTGTIHLNRPVVGMAVTVTGNGYWLVASDGGIFAFGDAGFYGSTGAIHLNQPIVGMAATPSGKGYWLVASDGGIFAFGDARFFGSTGAIHLNKPIVGMAATPSGHGYWLVASDGGIFAFGDAKFLGSTGAIHLNRPIVGMAATVGGTGYWLVASDGGIFAFGDAKFLGSTGAIHLNRPIVGMALSPTGRGYWLVASDGGIFSFGDANFYGSEGGTRLNQPIITIGTQPISHFG